MLDALDRILNQMHSHMFASTIIPALAVGVIVYLYLVRRHQTTRVNVKTEAAPADTLLLMPDITGFSQFVFGSGEAHAEVRKMTLEILDAVIASVGDRLTLAKIEGDSILYFTDAGRWQPSDVSTVLEDIFQAFDDVKERFARNTESGSEISAQATALNLKIIIHRGSVSTFPFRGSDDVFGAPVIALHRLAKHTAQADRYVLVSHDAHPLVEMSRFVAVQEQIVDLPDLGKMHVFVAKATTAPEKNSTHLINSTEENMFNRRIIRPLLAAALGFTTLQFAYAHSGATGVVKQRMDMMKDMGKSMKSIAGMLRGKQPYDAEHVRKLATEMQGHAGHIPMMFPEGTDKDPSEAKPTIWSDPEGFAKSAKALGEYAAMLATNSADQNVAGAAFQEIGKTCKSCHTDYRVKKE